MIFLLQQDLFLHDFLDFFVKGWEVARFFGRPPNAAAWLYFLRINWLTFHVLPDEYLEILYLQN